MPGPLRVLKLGKKPPKTDPRTFQIAKFIASTAAQLPTPPTQQDWTHGIPKTGWGVMGNDEIGDCTTAAAGHMIRQWTSYTAPPPGVIPSDDDVIKAYSAVSGYVPGDESTDQGATLLDVLNYWRKTGIAGHKILAFAQVNLKNVVEVRQTIALFGNLYLGVQLPITAQGQNVWSVMTTQGDGAPGTWGGHCVPMVEFDPNWSTVITWGQALKMSWTFLREYADEAYAVISMDWVAKNGLAPSKFNLKQLQADLAAIK